MSKKLLLADDSVVIQKLVGLSFANEDIEIISTDNGDDAVRLAKEARPDVVLADVVMPGLSGYEVCEAIRQDPDLANTPVLLLTGTFEAFDEARAASAGANGQVTKPFEAQALVERVNAVMAAPAPEAPSPDFDAEETLVAPAPPTANDDLFDADVSQLAAADPSLDPHSLDITPDVTPSLAVGVDDANETTASGLFGAPGEGASDILDTEGGRMALGQSVSDAPAAPSAEETLLMNADGTLPPLSERVSEEEPIAEAIEEAPIDPLPPARPLDLDEALAQMPLDDDAPTIVAATQDANATTSPAFTPDTSETVDATGGFEDLTVHVPSADIDQDGAMAPTPAYASVDGPDAGDVADLDSTLHGLSQGAASTPTPTPPPTPPPIATPAPPPIPEPHAAPPEAETIVHAADPLGSTGDPLGLAPASVDSDDVDFAFDVSEQATTGDAYDESFSSLMDISESQLLADVPPAPPANALTPDVSSSESVLPPRAAPATAPVRPSAHSESIGVGYDVSSSDLATAPGGDTLPPQSRPTPPPLPEPDPPLEIRSLPAARQPTPSAAQAEATMVVSRAASEPVTGRVDLFDGLSTGSPFDELRAATDFADDDDLETDDDLDLDRDLDEDLARADAFANDRPLDANEDLLEIDPPGSHATSFEPLDSYDEATEVAASFAAAPNADLEITMDDDGADDAPIDEPESAPAVEPAFATAVPAIEADVTGGDEDRRVADLSPMMEQRIQETLEKVAWEAFSDLSETIVKQVMGRVEQIAWEVIPEMAETLVREEIRRMKGDDD